MIIGPGATPTFGNAILDRETPSEPGQGVVCVCLTQALAALGIEAALAIPALPR